METSPIKNILRENWKYILFLAVTTQILIYLTGSIDYNNPVYSNSDFHKYISMAEKAPNINQEIIKPFAYRIIIPWLAGIMPFSITTNFMIFNNIGLIFLSVSVFIFFIDHNFSGNLSFFLTIFFQFNKYFFLFNTWNFFQAGDLFSLGILFLSFLLLKRKQWIIMLLLFPFSILIKEYILFLLPAGFIYLVKNSKTRSDYLYFTLISVLSIGTFIFVRKIIVAEEGLSLLVQYKTEGLFYIQPYYLIKRFIIPFTPFGLVPLVYYKRTYQFLKEHKYYIVYFLTVIILSFLGEPERLMAPLSPIYFVLVGYLIKDILSNLNKKNAEIYFISILLVISFAASVYHLWGVITIPNKEFVMILTVLTNLLMIIVFKFFNKSKVLNSTSVKI